MRVEFERSLTGHTEDLCHKMLTPLDPLPVDVFGVGKVGEFKARLVGVKTRFHNPKKVYGANGAKE